MNRLVRPLPASLICAAAVAAAVVVALSATAGVHQSQTASVLTRMNSAYRSMQSYYDVATIRRKVGEKEVGGSLTLAMQRPNKYVLDLAGDGLNTTIVRWNGAVGAAPGPQGLHQGAGSAANR